MVDIIEKYRCGLTVHPTNEEDLLEKIIFLKNSPDLVTEMGKNSRKLAETKFDKSILCKKFVEVIDSV